MGKPYEYAISVLFNQRSNLRLANKGAIGKMFIRYNKKDIIDLNRAIKALEKLQKTIKP